MNKHRRLGESDSTLYVIIVFVAFFVLMTVNDRVKNIETKLDALTAKPTKTAEVKK